MLNFYYKKVADLFLNDNEWREKMEKENLKEKKKMKINFKILAIVLIGILCIAITPVTFQNDTYYTIKIGELIKTTGIDMIDHFSWHEGLSYTYPHWLYDLLTYVVYEIFNFRGVYILTCILSVTLGISIYLVNSKLTKSNAISFIVTIGVLYMIQDYIAARAQLVTFILFIWEIYLIEKFIESKKKRYAIGLFAISLLIANLHVAVWPFLFVLFLPYIGEYFISIISDIVMYQKLQIFFKKCKIKRLEKKQNNQERLKKLKQELIEIQDKNLKVKIKRDKEIENPYKIKIVKQNNVKWIILVMVICLLAGLITPLGDTPYTYLYKTMQGNTTQNISEHLPMTLANNTDVICMILIFLAIMTFTKTKIRLSDLFMLGGLCYLMLCTRRQVSMFSLICSVILVRLVINLIEIYDKPWLQKFEEVFKNLVVCITLTVLIILLSYDTIKPKLDDEYVNTKSYPVYACDYILENIDLENARFFNEYNYGSYMIYRGIPVFIDSRADLYAPEFSGNKDKDVFSDFINTSGISTFYEDTFEKYDITHVICLKKSKINLIITKTKDKKYKLLYSDDNFVVYERIKE